MFRTPAYGNRRSNTASNEQREGHMETTETTGSRKRRSGGRRYPRVTRHEGDYLRELVTLRLGSVAEAARRLNRSPSSLGYWLSGSQGLPSEEFTALATILGSTPEALLSSAARWTGGPPVEHAQPAATKLLPPARVDGAVGTSLVAAGSSLVQTPPKRGEDQVEPHLREGKPVQRDLRGNVQEVVSWPGSGGSAAERWTHVVYSEGRQGAGDPLAADEAQRPQVVDRRWLEGHEMRVVGARGFGVRIRGEHLGNWGIRAGDICWVDPAQPPKLEQLALARRRGPQGEDWGLVVRRLMETAEGQRTLTNDGAGEADPLAVETVQLVGLVVWVTPAGFVPSRLADLGDTAEDDDFGGITPSGVPRRLASAG